MTGKTKRVALVTGGNKGIGYEICRGIASRDITVLLGARDIKGGKKACLQLQAEGLAVYFIQLDVTDSSSITAAVNQIAKSHG